MAAELTHISNAQWVMTMGRTVEERIRLANMLGFVEPACAICLYSRYFKHPRDYSGFSIVAFIRPQDFILHEQAPE